MKRSLLAVLLPQPALAAVTLFVGEPVGAAGRLHGGGHASVYLSNVCSDDSMTVRRCRVGEEGIVVGSYGLFAPTDDYYWIAVPLNSADLRQ